MSTKLCGVLLTKRKKADGTIALALEATDVGSDEGDGFSAISAGRRVVQLLISRATTLVYDVRHCGELEVLPLLVAGAYVQAVGSFEHPPHSMATPGSAGRPRLSVTDIAVLRVAPVPDSVARVLEAARISSGARRELLSGLIRPSSQLIPPPSPQHLDGPSAAAYVAGKCLESLLSGEISVRQHCRLMNHYNFDKSSRNQPRKQPGEITQYKRPPRTRTRKANYKEKKIIEDVVHRAERLLQQVPGGLICISCDSDESDGSGKVASAHLPAADGDFSCASGDDEIGRDDCDVTASASVLNIPENNSLLPSSRGDLTRGEYLHGKKEPQVQWVVDRLFEMIGGEFKTKAVHIIDVGGGRCDLSAAIALKLLKQGIQDAVITVVDRNGSSLRAGKEYAERVGVAHIIDFVEADFNDYSCGFAHTPCSTALFVVALHACGDLSDLALEFAGDHQAGFVCVPCCFSKFFRREWLGGWSRAIEGAASGCADVPPYSRYDLGRLAESEPRQCSWATMRAINILRLYHLWLSSNELKGEIEAAPRAWQFSLESFSNSFSLRNMVLCGSKSSI